MTNASNKHLDTIKSVETTDDFHIGGLDELESLAVAAESAYKLRRKYIITFDATGSMQSYWSMAQHAVAEAVRQIKKRTHVPVAIKVLAYRDKDFDTDFKTESEYTDDEKYLKDFISSVRCHGGGDDEESIEVPLETAIEDSANQVIMLGDAPGKNDQSGLSQAKQLGGMKCPVYTLYLNNSCKRAFENIAKLSGGKAFEFGRMDTSEMEDILMVILCQDKALQIEYQPKSLEGRKYLEAMK